MEISIGFSTCPNDTFIFDALVNGKIDTEGLVFNPFLADVEVLNDKAFKNELDVTKLSYHALAYLTSNYVLCNAGSALGNNVGPLLVTANPDISEDENSINDCSIAIPGKYTTANFLLSLAFPNAQNKTEVLFSDIEKKVLGSSYDLGLLIHENRFTYEERGLRKIIDLGEFWQSIANCPIPLGGIVVRRDLDFALQRKIDSLIKKSLLFAFNNTTEAMPYVRMHAQEMSEDVMLKHINLYVNDFSIDLGPNGKTAVHTLFNKALEKGLIKQLHPDIFIP